MKLMKHIIRAGELQADSQEVMSRRALAKNKLTSMSFDSVRFLNQIKTIVKKNDELGIPNNPVFADFVHADDQLSSIKRERKGIKFDRLACVLVGRMNGFEAPGWDEIGYAKDIEDYKAMQAIAAPVIDELWRSIKGRLPDRLIGHARPSLLGAAQDVSGNLIADASKAFVEMEDMFAVRNSDKELGKILNNETIGRITMEESKFPLETKDGMKFLRTQIIPDRNGFWKHMSDTEIVDISLAMAHDKNKFGKLLGDYTQKHLYGEGNAKVK